MSQLISVTTELLSDPIFQQRCWSAEFDIKLCSVVTRCIVTQRAHVLFLINNDIKMRDTLHIEGKL